MSLSHIGWNPFFEAQFRSLEREDLIPARIASEHKERYTLLTENSEMAAEVSGGYRHRALGRADYPAVGDWVAMKPRPDGDRAIIHALLPRKSVFSRKAVLSGGNPDSGGKTDEQVLAANIDTVFLVSGLDNDFNLRRIERFLSVAWDSGAAPVILLNKADVCDDVPDRVAKVEAIAVGVDIHPISAVTGEGLEFVAEHIASGTTAVFLGSSGVGKSTIINSLLGEERLDTGGVRLDDSKGRHTTTHRELLSLPGGGVVIDTPGMRMIKLWEDENGLQKVFGDIEELAHDCRFGDCTHNGEPGCAIEAAIEAGDLERKRFSNYLKLQKELAHLERRKSVATSRRDQKVFAKRIKNFHKERKRLGLTKDR